MGQDKKINNLINSVEFVLINLIWILSSYQPFNIILKFIMSTTITTTTATQEVTSSLPNLKRLELRHDEYPGLDQEWRRLWNNHGSSMIRADEVTIEEYRHDPRKYSFTYPTCQGPEVFYVEDKTIPVSHPSGSITIRIYSPEGPGPFPVHLNFHGGGWVLGGLNSEAAWCRHMCNKASIKVIDVDYRMGPEFRYPTAIYDCWDAVKWVSFVSSFAVCPD